MRAFHGRYNAWVGAFSRAERLFHSVGSFGQERPAWRPDCRGGYSVASLGRPLWKPARKTLWNDKPAEKLEDFAGERVDARHLANTAVQGPAVD